MRLKDRVKTYNFWVSLASAILLIISTIGKKYNFSVDENMYNDLFTSFCGILVLLGIIVPPSKKNITNEIQTDFNETDDNSKEFESDEKKEKLNVSEDSKSTEREESESYGKDENKTEKV